MNGPNQGNGELFRIRKKRGGKKKTIQVRGGEKRNLENQMFEERRGEAQKEKKRGVRAVGFWSKKRTYNHTSSRHGVEIKWANKQKKQDINNRTVKKTKAGDDDSGSEKGPVEDSEGKKELLEGGAKKKKKKRKAMREQGKNKANAQYHQT